VGVVMEAILVTLLVVVGLFTGPALGMLLLLWFIDQ